MPLSALLVLLCAFPACLAADLTHRGRHVRSFRRMSIPDQLLRQLKAQHAHKIEFVENLSQASHMDDEEEWAKMYHPSQSGGNYVTMSSTMDANRPVMHGTIDPASLATSVSESKATYTPRVADPVDMPGIPEGSRISSTRPMFMSREDETFVHIRKHVCFNAPTTRFSSSH